MPDLRSNWLPFYRPYSFASQPFDCFAENIQFSRFCITVQPPFVRLPDYFFILSCLSLFVKILRPGFSVFCSSFSCLPAAAVLFRPVFLPPRPFCPKSIRLDVACVSYRKKGISGNFPMFHAGNTPIHAQTSCVLPPHAIFSLASNLCFLVPQSMLWYELEGTVAHRPVRFQYIIEYM